ncbi:DUF4145 domain-containing protein [Polyangium spumosum]|uniref:DUF4145 domain-containing protein n=1 Tax=Polyangium spumosum TaxID=889282 RepID=A0A6N7Q2P3_9BACT|nr:DUF4145 domain-containing protein [Polyangium spumosum]MRG98618.1 DUF4145 domain-containing protein [Polyangium spumosum]
MAKIQSFAVKSFCCRCGGLTNHTVLREESRHRTQDKEPDLSVEFATEQCQIVACGGCDGLSFRRVVTCSEDYDQETGMPVETVEWFPSKPVAVESEASLPIRRFPHLPETPKRIYRETVGAFNNELYTLAAGGLRAAVEAICLDNGITEGPVEEVDKSGAPVVRRKSNLQGKIGGLAEGELLTKKHADVLHAHRYMGNEALHELEMPDPDDLKEAIEILEHTFTTIYELKHRGDALKLGRS